MFKTKTLVSTLLSALMIIGCSNGSVNNGGSNSSSANFTVTAVKVGKMTGDSNAADFSTTIAFTYNGSNTSTWQFGFYMPRSFASLTSATQNINPNLTMEICNTESPISCAALKYQQAKSLIESDLSAGYSTILAPQDTFTLVSGQQYTVKLLHNNQWNAGNYSAVPQNFFIISGNSLANATPESGIYNLLDYDAAAVNAGIVTHNNSDWTNSNSQSSAVNLVPTPVS
jgi:hypothetical protein